jgi:carbamoyl-phosphate synthase large subunit
MMSATSRAIVDGGGARARPNVLITSAARKVPLIRAFRRATAVLGGRVLAADVSPLAAALYEADSARLIPRSEDPGFIDGLLALVEREEVGLVVPTRDEELPILAAARDRFAAAGTLVLVSSTEAVEACQDKGLFAEAVTAAGLEAPRMYDGADAVTFPAFVKPRRGKGGSGARRVADAADLAAALAAAGPDALIQELVAAPELTIDTFLDLDGQPITCVPRERIQVVAGESVVSRTVRDAALVAATLRLCTSIGLIGHVTVQAFRAGERILFIEVNPRYGGAANLGFEAGARTPALALRLARGERLTPRLDEYEVGLTMLRSASDRFVRERELVGAHPESGRPAGRGIEDGAATAPAGPWDAALFDLDDTLYPEHQFLDGGFRAAAALIARELDRPPEPLHQRLWELHTRDGRGRLFDTLLDELGHHEDRDLALGCLHAYRTHQPRLTPVAGLGELLERLHGAGIRLGLVSDGLSSVQRRKLEALGPLADRFEAVVLTDELGPGHAKPSPDGFRIACNLLRVPPSRAVYVANDDRKDFEGARVAGLATIRFGTAPDEGGGVDRQGRPTHDSDHVAHSVEDLARLLLTTSNPAHPR